jgi:hypothetical protein
MHKLCCQYLDKVKVSRNADRERAILPAYDNHIVACDADIS